jgi:hypothetical protein
LFHDRKLHWFRLHLFSAPRLTRGLTVLYGLDRTILQRSGIFRSRVHDPAEEQDAARVFVLNKESERMIGTETGIGNSNGFAPTAVATITTAVAAAASVPFSPTSTNALCRTALMSTACKPLCYPLIDSASSKTAS